MERRALCALLLAATPAQAACPDLRTMALFAQAILEGRAPEPFRNLSIDDARCAQDRLVAFLAQPWGDAVGYRIALAPGGAGPMRGTIFHATLRATSPARLQARSSAAPVMEAALLLRIGRDGIAAAGEEPVAILRHIDQVIPFIMVSDAVAQPYPADLIARNLGTRAGVVGTPIAVEPSAEFARGLGALTVLLLADQRELSRANGGALQGHPLGAISWLVRDLAREGRVLRAGEYVALGGFSPPAPVEAGTRYTLRIEGLPGAMPVTVTLE